ncbi:MAG: YeeE/YedE family protein [Fimbriimonadaceae bacterium]|nr:YeeE/YedE family protein [Fimbriimonadaceae bacterium]
MMGPFVPEPITDQLNLVVALVLGVAFGYVLEQAGFSSSRRLAGLFYGYDFTVLRVFFTAAITTMAGVALLGYFGFLDLSAIFVNPTWLWPAVVGGIVMGLGFVLGGYCPGTSVAALSIGKVDALFFVLGGLLGVFAFGEAYPLVASFNDSSSLGPQKVYEALGMSAGAFAFLLIVVALAAFAATGWIERRVNPQAPSKSHAVLPHRLAAAGLLALGLVLLVLPERKAAVLASVARPEYAAAHPLDSIDGDELAYRLMDRDPNLAVYDLRSEDRAKARPLPRATALTMDALFQRDLVPALSRRHVTKVVVGETADDAANAVRVMLKLGYVNVRPLSEGFDAFARDILAAPDAPPTREMRGPALVASFRSQARQAILAQLEEEKKRGTVKKATKKIAGGC